MTVATPVIKKVVNVNEWRRKQQAAPSLKGEQEIDTHEREK